MSNKQWRLVEEVKVKREREPDPADWTGVKKRGEIKVDDGGHGAGCACKAVAATNMTMLVPLKEWISKTSAGHGGAQL